VSGVDANRRSPIQAALQDGMEKLQELELHPSTRLAANLILRLNTRDPLTALDSVGRLLGDLRRLEKVAEEIYESGLAAEYEEAQARPFEDAWIAYHLRMLARCATGPEWAKHWLDAWMEAVSNAAWTGALKILRWLREPDDDFGDLREDMRAITRELEAGKYPTMRSIDRLLACPHHTEATAVRLSVLKARTLLLRHGNQHEADKMMTRVARQKRDIAADLAALVQAVRAEIALVMGDLNTAKRYVHDALLRDEVIPDRTVVAGRIALAERDWARARELFDAAAARFGTMVEQSKLLAVVPPNLILAVARLLREGNPEASAERYEAITNKHAIETRLVGKKTRRDAMVEYADLLVGLEQPTKAAAMYARAADEDLSSDEALTLLQQAHELAPDNPDYCFSLGEQLRSRAMPIDGTRDTELVRQARGLLQQGLQIAGSDQVPKWALVSLGLAAHPLGEDPDPALWLERAIVRETPSANDFALLAWLHRLNGFPRASERAARFGADHGPIDSFLAEQWIRAHMDLGHYDEAEAVLSHPGTTITEDLQAMWRGWIACWKGSPQDGLALADGNESPFAPVVRMACKEVLGDELDTRNDAEQIWADRDKLPLEWVGWAHYALGDIDQAIDVLDNMYRRAPAGHVCGLRLGLLLLVRGDIGRGEGVLRDSIKHAYFADDLVQLQQVYLDQTARRLADEPHQPTAQRVLDAARDAATLRLTELRDREPDSNLLSERMAEAHRRWHSGELAEAMREYSELSRINELPEARVALRKVASDILAGGDKQWSDGHRGVAYATWAGAADALQSADPAADVLDDLVARLGLSELAQRKDDDPDAIAHLRVAGEDALLKAAPLFASTLDAARMYEERLNAVAPRRTQEDQEKFNAVARAVFERLLSMKASDANPRAFSPAARACEILLGPRHAGKEYSPHLAKHIPALREQVKSDFGLAIPGVRVDVSDRYTDTSVTFRVFEQVVAQMDLVPEPDLGSSIMQRFEDIVSDNMFRWMLVDDLELWNMGWSPDSQAEAELPEDLTDRVRLVRILRALLSEGIPVTQRSAIMEGFWARAGRGSALSTMTAIRSRLYPAITGQGDTQIRQVPDEIEESISSALDPGRTIMKRDRAIELRRRLQEWRRGLEGQQTTISVGDTALRPFVWHLLAADRPRMFVVAEEEIPVGKARR
jgi:tetratricopeptide (TPR) repeat protein